MIYHLSRILPENSKMIYHLSRILPETLKLKSVFVVSLQNFAVYRNDSLLNVIRLEAK